MPPGNLSTSPIRTAIDSGFHSMVEILLQEGAIDQEEKNAALIRAIDNRNFDLLELLARYVGRNRNVISMSMIFLRLFILRSVSEFR
jgi:hypothetical protein